MVNNQDSREARLLAMLIDGDNAQPSLLELVLAEAAKYGLVTTRRIYGDWTEPQMSGWKDSLQSLAVQPVQQFHNSKGKNATDSALIIDAMDLLHSGNVGGFCIVSSDGDFTRLATRIRERGMFVMGVGRKDTPESFVNACEVFVYAENLSPKEINGNQKKGKSHTEWTKLVEKAIGMSSQDDGWALLSAVGLNLRKLKPAFDARTYGHEQLSQLVKSRPDLFEMKGEAHLSVKVKP